MTRMSIDGNADAALWDARGQVDSIGVDGNTESRIPGCIRSANASGNSDEPMAVWSFASPPQWPLIISWRDRDSAMVSISGITIAGADTCTGSKIIDDVGSGRVNRWKVSPVRSAGKQCRLEFVALP